MQSAFVNRVQVIYATDPVALLYYDYFGNQLDIIPEDYTVDQVNTVDDAMADIRSRRNELLTACDWTQLPDAPLTDTQRLAWRMYRKALRDYPALIDIDTWSAPEFPTPPTE